MSPRTGVAGWYGKLAMLGDFAARRLPPPWTQACDRWLADGIEASRGRLGERWLQVYLSAPVWRFVCAPGVIDEHWWFGVLMPSCDNVGRYFPLVVAQSRVAPPIDRIGLDHLELWWAHMARAALRTLDPGATLDAFESALDQAPPWPSRPRAEVPFERGDASVRLGVAAGTTLGEIAQALAAKSMTEQLNGCSLWWPLADAAEPGHCTVVSGLPPAEAFDQLLTGRW
jgi:type VI secretion system protein ImpM